MAKLPRSPSANAETPDVRRPAKRQKRAVHVGVWFVVLILPGVALLIVGGLVEGYPQAVLVEIGAALLLLAPFVLLERTVARGLSEVRAQARETARDVESVREEVSRATARLEDLTTATAGRVAEDLAADERAFSSFEDHPDWFGVAALLGRALEVGAVTEHGVRIQVPDMHERLRFAAIPIQPEERPALLVFIEEIDGEEISELRWMQEVPTQDFMQDVARVLQRHGRYPGHEGFDVSVMFRQLLNTLRLGITLRRKGSALDLAPLIEVPGQQWAVTTAGLQCLRHPYFVGHARLKEDGFRSHVMEKTWVNSDELYDVWDLAEALHIEGRATWLASVQE